MRLRSYASFAFASYYASNTARRTRIIAAGLYACFLLISVIPEFIDVTTDAFGYFSSDPYRDWPLLFFFYGHALFIQPIITALTTTSLLFQVHEIIIFADTRSALSLSWLALQAVTFAVLGFSWFGHINFDDDDDAETFLDWYIIFGWPIVEDFIYVAVQVVLPFVAMFSKSRDVAKEGGTGEETEPLLGQEPSLQVEEEFSHPVR